MPQYAYIDESGTMDYQEVMTVAMVVFEGVNSAAKLHEHVMAAVNPQYLQLVRKLKKERRQVSEWPNLHFADMDQRSKHTAATRMAKANLTVFTGSHWHCAVPATHDDRFAIYTELVKLTISKAFGNHKDLIVAIGKQGGWQKYERGFFAKLRLIPEQFTRKGTYRNADFVLVSATKQGIQIADFYAGAVRDFLRVPTDSSHLGSYDLLKHHVLAYDTYAPETYVK